MAKALPLSSVISGPGRVLRKEILRLARQRPDARRVLLALLQKSALGIGVGNTEQIGMLRVHRYRPSVVITDLTNGGKRGKRVDQFTITFNEHSAEITLLIENYLQWLVSTKPDYQKALLHAQVMAAPWTRQHDSYSMAVHQSTFRGVDVAPAEFRKIKIDGKHVTIEADYKDFTVRDKDDQNNLPTCIPAIRGGAKDIPVFYRWVAVNAPKIQDMTYHDVITAMMSQGIKFHDYCAMD